MCNIKEYEESIDKIKEVFDAYFPLIAKLDDDIKEVNGSICDSYHYMEFTNLGVVDGFKAYKDLQQKLQLRRKLKTNVDYLKSISGEFKTANAMFNELDKKYADPEYKPRVNDDLFKTETSKSISKPKPVYKFNSLDEAAKFLHDTCGKRRVKTTKIAAAIDYEKAYYGYLWFCDDNIISCKKAINS